MLGIGIDFGTSNSSVALFDGRQLRYVTFEAGAAAPEVMASALYLARDRSFEIGQRAIEAYTRDNAGRSIRLSREDVGQIEVSVSGTGDTQGSDDGGGITEVFHVHAFTDREMPGRLFRGVKRWLGNPALEGVRVFDASYRIVALVTPMLAQLRERTRGDLTDAEAPVYVGRPVRYPGRSAEANDVATRRMRDACGYAELGEAVLFPEPVAAALSFLHGLPKAPEGVVLAFDFGGGTLDLCLLRSRAGRFEPLCTLGVGLGGDDIDRLICRTQVFPELGEGSAVRRPIGAELRSVPFPFQQFSGRLLNWMHAHELNRPELLECIAQGMREGGETGRRLARLHAVVTQNRAYEVFQAVEAAKLRLSDAECARIDVPEIELSVPITRSEFETALAPLLADIEAAVGEALERASVPPETVSVVVRTGGSSRIPAVVRLLERMFPGRVVEHDPFRSIAAGLAIASFRGAQPPPLG